MTRFVKLFVLLAAAIALTGCLNEKYGNCPIVTRTGNVTLAFTLPDASGNCTFRSDISKVDVAVYNQAGSCVTHTQVDQTALTDYKGVILTLDPGTYSVVCWGNVLGGSVCNGVDSEHSLGPHVTYGSLAGGVAETCDGVYYGPREGRTRAGSVPGSYEMTVDPLTGHTGEIAFTTAHRTMEIYVEGYNGTPVIEMTGLPAGLSFYGMGRLRDSAGNPQTVTGSKTTTPVTVGGVPYDFATFNTFWFDPTDDIAIRVVNPITGNVDYQVALADAIEVSDDSYSIVIRINLKFTGSGVEITVPTWSRDDIDPGFGW